MGQWFRKPVAKTTPAQQEIESLLTVARHFDPAVRLHLAERAQGELDLEGAVLDQKDICWPCGRGAGGRLGGWVARL
jgi:hypothetical protein